MEKVKERVLNKRKNETYKQLSNLLWVKNGDKYFTKECFKDVTYELLLRQNNLWKSYALEMMTKYESKEEAFLNMTFYGCEISVIQSQNPFIIGFNGIIFKDEKLVFWAKGKDMRSRRLHKNGTLFKIVINNIKVMIDGKNFTKKNFNYN